MIQKILLSSAAAMLLGGCAHYNVVPTEQATAEVKKSAPASPKQFQSSYIGGEVHDNWLRTFRDPTLNKLVKEAQKSNPDLMIAASRLERATAIMHLSESYLMPRLDLRGNYQFRSWEASDKHDKGDISLSLRWEPDLWGRVSNAIASDTELTAATAADFEWARQSLSSQTARAWFLLGADRMIYDFQKEVLAIQIEAARVLDERVKIGAGTERDLHMMRGMVAESRERTQAALAAKERDTRALEVLIGRYPGNRLKARSLHAVTGKVPSGLPAGLLNRRPDIIAAQYRVASAFHHTEEMKLLRLPNISLEGRFGVDIIQDSMAKFIGGIFMPIFDAGKIQAQIDAATAEQKAAIADYQRVVLDAYREVEDALAQEEHLARRESYLKTMVKEFKTAYAMTNENYKIGQGTILDVLNAQSKWINAKILHTQVRKERMVNRVNLHLALGGSFDTAPTQDKAQ
jgi:NodT family efflux transporter outer membrane factor (OMF) lipoprotein